MREKMNKTFAMNPNFYLFVDDERDAKFLQRAYPKVKYGTVTIPDSAFFEVARTVEQAKDMVRLYGFPAVIAMDNDLGEGQPEGYEFVRWLLALDEELNWMTPEFVWVIHSMNPINSKKMMQDLEDYYNRKFGRK